MIKITAGEKIKAERLKKNISQAELARLTGISRRTIQDWELGKSKPNNLKGILRLGEILNITSNDL